jgi:hypothetical protein
MKTLFSHLALSLALVFSLFLTPSAAQQSFEVTSLTTTSAYIIEHEPVTGDDRGGIALSQTNIFYTGDNSTGAFSISNLSNAFAVGYQYDSLVSDLRTKQVYALGTQFGIVPNGGDMVTRLVPLDGQTGQQIPGDIVLSTPIWIQQGSAQAGIFSGWNRVVLLDGNSMNGYNVDLPSGIVTPLGQLNLYSNWEGENDRCGCENWATWGVAESTASGIKLVYAANPYYGYGPSSVKGFMPGAIKRYDVTTANIATVADFPMGISDMCSMTVDPANNRWYFHYESYSGAFGFGMDENIGYADATFLAPSSAPAYISGRVLAQKGRGLSGVIVKAVGPEGKLISTVTNSYGNYTLKGLMTGQTYVISVESRKYYFPVSSEVVQLDADLTWLDFEAAR